MVWVRILTGIYVFLFTYRCFQLFFEYWSQKLGPISIHGCVFLFSEHLRQGPCFLNQYRGCTKDGSHVMEILQRTNIKKRVLVSRVCTEHEGMFIMAAICYSRPLPLLLPATSTGNSGRHSSFVSPKRTRPTLHRVHCVPQEGGRVQGWESECWGVLGIFENLNFECSNFQFPSFQFSHAPAFIYNFQFSMSKS